MKATTSTYLHLSSYYIIEALSNLVTTTICDHLRNYPLIYWGRLKNMIPYHFPEKVFPNDIFPNKIIAEPQNPGNFFPELLEPEN